MLAINVWATLGCIIGAGIGGFITGPIILIPFFVALVLYNLPKEQPKKKIAR